MPTRERPDQERPLNGQGQEREEQHLSIKRRHFLRATAAAPVIGLPQTATPETPDSTDITTTVARRYFRALPETKEDRNQVVIECANELCRGTAFVTERELSTLVEGGELSEDIIRRVQFTVRILNELDITHAVDEAAVASSRWTLDDVTKYVPLIGSFNRLRKAACAINPPNPDPEHLQDFLIAVIAFGIEVALWTSGAPYKMAWNGTRWISNRTFLRLTRYGCHGCIAFAMSELHWAIRASVYGHGITESRIEFVWEKIQELDADAERWGYDADLDYSIEEIRELVGEIEDSREVRGGGAIVPAESEGPIEKFLPDFLDDLSLDFPDFSLTDLFS